MSVFGPSGRAGARLRDVGGEALLCDACTCEPAWFAPDLAELTLSKGCPIHDDSAPGPAGWLSFHQAWGEAKDRPDYNKEDWKGAQTRVEACEFTLAEWLTLVRGMRVLAPGWRRL